MRLARTVLWSATLRPSPLLERVDAAAVNGYAVLSVSPRDHDELVASGLRPGAVAREARGRGVELAILDGIVEWHPHQPPKRPFVAADYSVDRVLAMCEDFGARSVSALAPFPVDLPLEGLAEHFARLCDRAADVGCRVHFEFTPRSPVSDVGTAWELVRLAGRPNGGIVFDTWHFFRVNPDFDVLSSVPGERIFAVQVNDGGTELVEGLLADTFRHRRLPGQGDFDLARVLRTLDAIGGLNLVGPEVLSEELFALPPVEAARLAGEAFDAVAAALAAS